MTKTREALSSSAQTLEKGRSWAGAREKGEHPGSISKSSAGAALAPAASLWNGCNSAPSLCSAMQQGLANFKS